MLNNRRSFLGVGVGATLTGLASQSDAEAGMFHRRRTQCVASPPPCAPVPGPVGPSPIEPSPAPPLYQLPDGSYAFAPSHDFKIGTAHWTSFKTDRINRRPPLPPIFKYYKCDDGADVIAAISHPRIEEIVPQINECLSAAAVASAVAVIIAAVNGAAGGTGVAVGTFQAALTACLAAKGVGDASAITVHLSTANSTQSCHPI